MNTIEVLAQNECCGCSACFQKCPQNAINMIQNNEGFSYPIIDKKKCINCGLCSKVCPQLKPKQNSEGNFPKAYAMYNKDKEELLKSSSGGIFSVIARYVLENNGVVFGATYTKNLSVNHIKIDNIKDLDLLRGSKYVQSNINNTYIEAEKILKTGKLVLYVGTPCQIFGLKSFLMKDYDNLITCDLVCHGVPSEKLFKKYLEYLSNKFKSKVIEYSFRNKSKNGWGLTARVLTQDKKERFINSDFDPYYYHFLNGTIYRESCYNCHYSTCNRCSEITLADYWGIKSIHPDFFSENGRSLILINNIKGEKIIQNIKDDIEFINTNLEFACSKNRNLIEPSKRKEQRNDIYMDIDNMSADKYIKKKLAYKITCKKIIKRIIPNRIKKFLKKIINV
ncbi:MAG TPA: coenzyme F420 hydrogenase [Clostridiales bacterium]|nr:coenzyme F420 hydrogenase [Clostridiales bacterium]